jgi:hypothetical protein
MTCHQFAVILLCCGILQVRIIFTYTGILLQLEEILGPPPPLPPNPKKWHYGEIISANPAEKTPEPLLHPIGRTVTWADHVQLGWRPLQLPPGRRAQTNPCHYFFGLPARVSCCNQVLNPGWCLSSTGELTTTLQECWHF